MIFHGNPLSFGQYFYDVWGGVSYWFTSALSVAQILLAALFLSQRDRMTFYVGTCTLLSLLGIYLRNKLVSKPYVFGIAAFVYLSYVMITNPAHPQGTTPDICMYLWKYLTILCSIICIIALSHLLPQAKWLEYIGKNSLIFYFFSGTMLALFGSITSLLAPDTSYILTLTVTSIALLAATGIN